MLSKFEKQSNKLYHAKYKMQILRGKVCCFVFFPQKKLFTNNEKKTLLWKEKLIFLGN